MPLKRLRKRDRKNKNTTIESNESNILAINTSSIPEIKKYLGDKTKLKQKKKEAIIKNKRQNVKWLQNNCFIE
tara:strand:+ start:618 stop:836 length:219 start_codon:yes stop_codon:yes gene_type:complete